jgi:hypothetical protein
VTQLVLKPDAGSRSPAQLNPGFYCLYRIRCSTFSKEAKLYSKSLRRHLHQRTVPTFRSVTGIRDSYKLLFIETHANFKSCTFSSLFWNYNPILAPRAPNTANIPMTADPDSKSNRSDPPPPARDSGSKLWQTALLLAASAAFGGLAVAFWNRKILSDIRNRPPEPPRRSVGREDDIY